MGQPTSSGVTELAAKLQELQAASDEWRFRVRRARAAGEWARLKLAGQLPLVPPSPPLPVPLHACCLAVLRARHGSGLRGIHTGPWWQVRGDLEDPARPGMLAPEVVFHSFPSVPEAEAYWRVATGEASAWLDFTVHRPPAT